MLRKNKNILEHCFLVVYIPIYGTLVDTALPSMCKLRFCQIFIKLIIIVIRRL